MANDPKSDLSRGFVLFAVALPVLCVIFGIVRSASFSASSVRYLFAVEGYDPRDLLRGHYIQYRLRVQTLGAPEACDDAREACCLCFDAKPFDLVSEGYKTRCDAPAAACSARISTRYVDKPLRFYVPEARASEIEARLREVSGQERAQVLFAVGSNGEGVAQELRIDGVSVLAAQ